MQPGRKFSATDAYRYGFNGKENDNDVKGEGGQQDYGMRIYDPRLGKFLSVDPLSKSYPWYSPYHFAGNSPIVNIDLDGTEPERYDKWKTGGWSTYESFSDIEGDRSHIKLVNFGNLFGDDHNYVAIRDQKVKGKWWYGYYDNEIGALGNKQKGNWHLYNPEQKKYEFWTPEGYQRDDLEIMATARHLGKFGEVYEKVIINLVIMGTTGGIGSGTSLGSRFLLTRIGSVLEDGFSQATSGKSLGEMNLTSLSLSATTGLPAPVTSFGSSAYEFSIDNGFSNSWNALGLGGTKTTKQVGLETATGSVFNKLNILGNTKLGIGTPGLYRDLRITFNPTGSKLGMTLLPTINSFGTNYLSNSVNNVSQGQNPPLKKDSSNQ